MRLAVIPARYASTRFPGKPLADLAGQPLIRRVYLAVERAAVFDKIVVATDDTRIRDVVEEFGASCVMTASDHPSGTDRVAEAASHFSDASIVVNVQGDEPFVDREALQQLLLAVDSANVDIATLATPIREEHVLLSPNAVKVTRDARDNALYFSRHAIPYLRDIPIGRWLQEGRHWQHVGIYAFRSGVLPELTTLPPADLELAESLEQLRWLAAGYRIRVAVTDQPAIGIDTPADLELAARRFQSS